MILILTGCILMHVLLHLLGCNDAHAAIRPEWELVNDTDTTDMYLMESDGRDLSPEGPTACPSSAPQSRSSSATANSPSRGAPLKQNEGDHS